MEEREYKRRKRTQACLRCRNRKLKCEFTIDAKTCDRCRNLGTECMLPDKKQDHYTFEVMSKRLEQLETVTGELVQFLKTKFGNDLEVGNRQLKRKIVEIEQGGENKLIQVPSCRLGLNNEFGSAVNSLDNGNSGTTNNNDDDDRDHHGHNNDNNKGSDGRAMNTMASAASNSHEQNGDRPTTLLLSYQVKECVDYFVNNISKYLPVLIFDYMPEFQTIDSKLLVTAIVAVSTLFHPKYRQYHVVYVSEFSTILSHLKTTSGLVTPNASIESIDAILNDVLGLSIAGAWLGTELGFRAILLASNMIARVMPLFMSTDGVGIMRPSIRIALEPKLCAIGLVTYIIDRRLRIMHGRPVKHMSAAGFGTESQLSYLFSAMTRSQAGRVKAMANVDLCAVITNYQQELSEAPSEKIIICLTHFNEQLERWLAEWFGQMTVHLRPSSWKPLFLTLLYAKLLLNLHAVDAINNFQEGTDTRMDPFVTTAEISAIDILDMVVYNDDVPRLISYGPVFYPTIFVTAGASLLKLLWLKHEEKPIALNHSVESLYNLVKLAHSRLSISIYSPTMPCYDTVYNLGLRLERMADILRSTWTDKDISFHNNQETWDSSRFRLWGNHNRTGGDIVSSGASHSGSNVEMTANLVSPGITSATATTTTTNPINNNTNSVPAATVVTSGDIPVATPTTSATSVTTPVTTAVTTNKTKIITADMTSTEENSILDSNAASSDNLLNDSMWSFNLTEGDPSFLLDVHSTNLLDFLGDVGDYEGQDV